MTEVKEEAPVVQMNNSKAEKRKNITYEELYGINDVLGEARRSIKNAKGDVAYAISKNLEIAGRHLREVEKRRQHTVGLYASKNESGQIKFVDLTEEEVKQGKKPRVAFDEGEEDKCRDAIREIMKEEVIMEKPFRNIPYDSFKTAEVNIEQFKTIDFFIDAFVVEK